MKYLLILLAIGCTKIKYQEIKFSPEKNELRVSADLDWNKYSPQVDIMVAFLWPETIKAGEDQLKLQKVISVSRELKSRNYEFQKKNKVLKESYEINSCACVLNNECTGNETDLQEQVCYELEEEIYVNDRLLIDIFGLVEEIKLNVLAIGGEWLDTHMDMREIPTSKIDFEEMKISFSALGSYIDNGVKKPHSYELLSVPIIQEKHFKRLKVTFPRNEYNQEEVTSNGDWIIDAGIDASDVSILFQGELYFTSGSRSRRGIIYWENPKL